MADRGTTVGKAYVQIMPSTEGISGAISKALNKDSDSAGASFGGKLGGAIKKAIAVAGIGVAIGKSIQEGANLQQSIGGVETLFKDQADAVIKNADRAWKTAGISANEYMEQVTSFSASLISSLDGDTKKATEISNRAITDMSDNANRMGTSIEMVQNTYQSLARGQFQTLDNLKIGYGGTKSEMQRLIKDASKMTDVQKELGVTVEDGNMDFANMINAISVMQKSLGIMGATMEEAETTFSGSLNAMKSAITNVLGNIMLGRELESSMSALAESTSTFFFGNLLPALGRIATSLPVAFGSLIKSAIPQIGSQLANMGQMLSDKFGITGADAGISFISDLVANLISKLPVIAQSVATVMSNIGNWLVNNSDLIGAKVGELVGRLAKTIITHIPQILKALGRILVSVVKFSASLVKSFRVAGINAIKGLVVGLAPSGLASRVKGIVNAITNPFNKMKDAISNIIKKVRDAIKNMFAGIKISFPKLPKLHITWGNESKKGEGEGGLKVNVPLPHLSWYESGGIATSSAIVGIGEGRSDEAILPLDPFWAKMERTLDEMKSTTAGTGGGTLNLGLFFDGEPMYKGAVNWINGQTLQLGMSPLI